MGETILMGMKLFKINEFRSLSCVPFGSATGTRSMIFYLNDKRLLMFHDKFLRMTLKRVSFLYLFSLDLSCNINIQLSFNTYH